MIQAEYRKFLVDFALKAEKERQKAWRSFLIALLIGIALIVVSIILFVVWTQFDATGWMVAAFLSFLIGAVLLGVAFGLKGQYQKKITNSIRLKTEAYLYKNMHYENGQGFPLSEILSLGFLSAPDRYRGTNLTSGLDGAIPFHYADFDFLKRQESTDSKGNRTVTYVSYAKGRIFRFDLPRDFKENWIKVGEKEFLSGLFGGNGNKVETEFLAFNKKFDLRSSSSEFAFYVLTPQIQEKILAFEGENKGRFCLALLGNSFYVLLQNNLDYPLPPLTKAITVDTLEAVASPYLFPGEFVEDFKLESSKYLPNAGA